MWHLFNDDAPETWALSLAEQGGECATKGTGVLVDIKCVVRRRRYYLSRWRDPRSYGPTGHEHPR